MFPVCAPVSGGTAALVLLDADRAQLLVHSMGSAAA